MDILDICDVFSHFHLKSKVVDNLENTIVGIAQILYPDIQILVPVSSLQFATRGALGTQDAALDPSEVVGAGGWADRIVWQT